MAYTDREDLNYLGQLYLVGGPATPFLNAIGGLQNGAKISKSFNFPVAQTYGLAGASQDATSEALAAAAGTPNTVVRAQAYNTIQIMKKDYGVSFAKQSTVGEMGGISIQGDQPVQDELGFQRTAQFKQLAVDIDFSFLQGAYVAQSVAATVATTRGLKNAITTNAVAAGGARLTKAMVKALMIAIANTNKSLGGNMMMLANAFNIGMISDIFGYAPEDRKIGGVAIDTIITDFAKLGVVWAPNMPVDEIYVVDAAVCSPVFVPYKGQLISDVPVGIVAAQESGFWYTQVGLDYGPQTSHGKITGLASS